MINSSRYTLVTACIDLQKREPHLKRRGMVDHYLKDECCQMVIQTALPIVIYADPHCVESIKSKRSEYDPLMTRTMIIEKPLEQMYYYKECLAQVEQIFQVNPVKTHNKDKDTVLYTVLTWSKMSMMQETIQTNPFGSTHFAWVDFGLGTVVLDKMMQSSHGLAKDIFTTLLLNEQLYDQVSIGNMNYVSDKEIVNLPDFWSRNRCKFVSGFLTGNASYWSNFCQQFQDLVEEALSIQCAPLEEALFAVLWRRRPHMFRVFYTDYQGVLLNYHGLQCNLRTVLWNLQYLVAQHETEEAQRIIQSIERSCNQQAEWSFIQ